MHNKAETLNDLATQLERDADAMRARVNGERSDYARLINALATRIQSCALEARGLAVKVEED